MAGQIGMALGVSVLVSVIGTVTTDDAWVRTAWIIVALVMDITAGRNTTEVEAVPTGTAARKGS